MSDFSAYVFYVNRPDLLVRSISAFPDVHGNLTIVDNSVKGNPEDPRPENLPFKVFVPPVPFSYAQSMNWMLKDSLEKKVDFIIHFHSDAYSNNPHAVEDLLSCVRQYRDEGRRWACAWTFYDILWCINPKALQDIGGWDTNLPNYFGDNDARRRFELAGWECIDTHIEGLGHEGSATVNSDPELKYINSIAFPLAEKYYVSKWGGSPGSERFSKPFGWAWKPKFHSIIK